MAHESLQDKINYRRNLLIKNMTEDKGNILELIKEKLDNLRSKFLDENDVLIPFSYLNDGTINSTAISPWDAIMKGLEKYYEILMSKIISEW